MRFAISIPQFVSDGEFDPARFRAYMARAEALGFESAWTLEQTLGTMPKAREVELKFSGKILGDHRQHILAAYSRFLLAEELWDRARSHPNAVPMTDIPDSSLARPERWRRSASASCPAFWGRRDGSFSRH